MNGLPRDWLPTLVQLLVREPVVVRIVVAAVRGSTPREPGAFMLVGRDSVEGSIGGGKLEWEAIAAARELLAEDSVPARVNRVVLGADVGQCCGGVVSVWLDRFTRESLHLLQMAGDAGSHGSAVLSSTIRGAVIERRVVCGLGVDEATDRLLSAPRPRAYPSVTQNSVGDLTFLERLDDELPSVWLYGAGHVGKALARILMELPLRLTWIDSRAELFPATVPEGVRILRDADSVATVSEAPVGAYFLVMSHSHPLDFALCHALLERHDFAWLGLIGSMSKAARFRSRLSRAGLGADVIADLVCPIGVGGITSKWPAAIAVGVAAQLMQQISAATEKPGLSREGPALTQVLRLDGARPAAERAERPESDGPGHESRKGETNCTGENCATCGSAAGSSATRPATTAATSADPHALRPHPVTS
jgi:xanthine dehydrogenase accessory factor